MTFDVYSVHLLLLGYFECWVAYLDIAVKTATPGGAPMYQVWWKSTQGFLRFRVNEVKIAYLDQVRPLTFDVGRII